MNEREVEKHIGVLDGIRAISIIFIVWCHIWQQSWLPPYIDFKSDMTKYLGITSIELANYVRFAFAFVDMLFLLSAFCNFYPYARSMLLGEKWPDTKEFYFKRAIRILPSYLLCIIIMLFVFALPQKEYDSTAFMWKDILTHLTFTQGFFSETVVSTKLNGVLWALQIEVLFYILIPWIAKLFRKIPGITYCVMLLIGIIFTNYIIYQHSGEISIYVNHMLTFMGVYANGILLSILFVTWKHSGVDNRYTRIAATVLSVCCIFWFRKILYEYGQAENLLESQLRLRLTQSFLFSGFIFFTACAFKSWQKIFSNRLMRFVCAISYNLYIWHQVIALKLKEYRIPFWEGDVPPNMTGDRAWQWKYTIIVLVASVLTAVVITYGFEIPVRKFFEKRRRVKNE